MDDGLRTRKKEACLILGLSLLTAVLYFVYLVEFYTNNYWPYDMFGYSCMWDLALPKGQMAYDGFSSLFLVLCKYGYQKLGLHVLTPIILAMNSLSVFLFCYLVGRIIRSWINRIILIFLFLSAGYMFYLYGKLLYEWPFTLLNTILAVGCIALWINKNRKVYEFIAFALLGLLLSWKPSNVFIVFPICVWLVFLYDKTELYICQLKDNCKRYIWNAILLGTAAMVGYLAGNFGLLIHTKGTLKGIAAYKASCRFISYLFKDRIAWDSINNVNFNLGVINVISWLVLLVIIPIAIKNYKALALSITMSALFVLFISHFSAGYVWHGFPFALYSTLEVLWLVFDYENSGANSKVWNRIMLCAVCLQFVICHFYYVPLQRRWDRATDKAYESLKLNDTQILADVSEIVDKLDDTYSIEVSFKRWVQDGVDMRSILSVDDIHSLPHSENRLGYQTEAKYYVCIDAKDLEATNRVKYLIMTHSYKDSYELIDSVDCGDYTISTYMNCSK